MKIKSKRKDKNGRKKKEGKNEKSVQRGILYALPRWTQKLIFYKELSREIATKLRPKKKSDFEHPTKTKKMKKNERKMEENERKMKNWKKMKNEKNENEKN